MKILVAPSGFKESLGASEVADAITRGIRRALPAAYIRTMPLVDGGEGFTQELVRTTGGSLHKVTITGPVGDPVEAYFGLLGGDKSNSAVLEMAAAAGLRLVPPDRRDPLITTTRGVGELIEAALDAGVKRILMGCGDSGTNDGGAGAAQALGVRMLDADGNDLKAGGSELLHIDHIDLSRRDERLEMVQIDVACNWQNVLCGPKGVARVFGPQKGASPETVEKLEAALEIYAAVIERDLGVDVRTMPAGGASGGLGAGLHALLGAKLHPRIDIVTQYLDLDGALDETDLVITAEGAIDFQTPRGKIPMEVAQRAKQRGLPVIAIVGSVGERANENFEYGIDAFFSGINQPMDLSMALEKAEDLVAACAENVIRTVLVGSALAQRYVIRK